jgi:hypothetical protein
MLDLRDERLGLLPFGDSSTVCSVFVLTTL